MTFLQHDQDKSPLSDSGFETKSEKKHLQPHKALKALVPNHSSMKSPSLRSLQKQELKWFMLSGAMSPPLETAPRPNQRSPCHPNLHLRLWNWNQSPPRLALKKKSKRFRWKPVVKMATTITFWAKACVLGKRLITTTTRMVYHSPPGSEGASERIEETMSVHDIMKAFQSGWDPSERTGRSVWT